jgi:hypothetical protein
VEPFFMLFGTFFSLASAACLLPVCCLLADMADC